MKKMQKLVASALAVFLLAGCELIGGGPLQGEPKDVVGEAAIKTLDITSIGGESSIEVKLVNLKVEDARGDVTIKFTEKGKGNLMKEHKTITASVSMNEELNAALSKNAPGPIPSSGEIEVELMRDDMTLYGKLAEGKMKTSIMDISVPDEYKNVWYSLDLKEVLPPEVLAEMDFSKYEGKTLYDLFYKSLKDSLDETMMGGMRQKIEYDEEVLKKIFNDMINPGSYLALKEKERDSEKVVYEISLDKSVIKETIMSYPDKMKDLLAKSEEFQKEFDEKQIEQMKAMIEPEVDLGLEELQKIVKVSGTLTVNKEGYLSNADVMIKITPIEDSTIPDMEDFRESVDSIEIKLNLNMTEFNQPIDLELPENPKSVEDLLESFGTYSGLIDPFGVKSAPSRARDVGRKATLFGIKTVLTAYYADRGQFPNAQICFDGAGTYVMEGDESDIGGGSLDDLKQYFEGANFPDDPDATSVNGCNGFVYKPLKEDYDSRDNTAYAIFAPAELIESADLDCSYIENIESLDMPLGIPSPDSSNWCMIVSGS